MGGGSLRGSIFEPTEANLQACALAIKDGQAVVMPTETVYGLACNGLDPEAVRRVFAIKGRPADNPLIVHVRGISDAQPIVANWPSEAERLARAFWPGPLTMVLPKADCVPSVVTGGLDSVAVRAPSHPVARALLAAVELPLCAPSANPFMGLSPTVADDVAPEIAAEVFAILDGGPCPVGIESSVLDLCHPAAAMLRLGAITKAQIEAVLGRPLAERSAGARRSPGQYPRHYAPRTPLELVEALNDEDAGVTFRPPANATQRQLPSDPGGYARGLYAALHDLDRLGAPLLRLEAPPRTAEWDAVWDRLRRASGAPPG